MPSPLRFGGFTRKGVEVTPLRAGASVAEAFLGASVDVGFLTLEKFFFRVYYPS